jgi:acetyl-CoA carboxylase biotin carboxyl carrier protein
MSEDASARNEPFDLERLRELIEIMEQHGLTEVSLRRGDEEWSLRRGGGEVMHMVPGTAVPAAVHRETTNPAAPDEDDGTVEIKSPTVGTFYAAPSPEDPPFVSPGSSVQADTIVCIVEAMKVFNQIPAELGGTIVEVLVSNGASVEFGQPLFRVRTG